MEDQNNKKSLFDAKSVNDMIRSAARRLAEEMDAEDQMSPAYERICREREEQMFSSRKDSETDFTIN